MPSPKEKDRDRIFMPTWWAAKAEVPRVAVITAVAMKPIRMRICSVNTLEAIFTMLRMGWSVSFIFSRSM